MIKWKKAWRTIPFNGEKDCLFKIWAKMMHWYFHFCNVHLQEVADKLWPRLQCFLRGHRGSIKVNNGTYSLPYETLLLLVLYRLSRPRHIREELKGFFGIRKSNISTGITCMIHAISTKQLWFLICNGNQIILVILRLAVVMIKNRFGQPGRVSLS